MISDCSTCTLSTNENLNIDLTLNWLPRFSLFYTFWASGLSYWLNYWTFCGSFMSVIPNHFLMFWPLKIKQLHPMWCRAVCNVTKNWNWLLRLFHFKKSNSGRDEIYILFQGKKQKSWPKTTTSLCYLSSTLFRFYLGVLGIIATLHKQQHWWSLMYCISDKNQILFDHPLNKVPNRIYCINLYL